jgi:cell surface protein SprA
MDIIISTKLVIIIFAIFIINCSINNTNNVSEYEYSWGEHHTMWFKASPAMNWFTENFDDYYFHPAAWKYYWYTPIESQKTPRKELGFTEFNNSNQANEYLNSLRLLCQPLPNDSSLLTSIKDDLTGEILVNPWAGIMIPISGSYEQDKRRYKYFKFWLKSTGKFGSLYLDFGNVRQDLSLDGGIPNRLIDTEIKGITNEYKPEYDLGIDFLTDECEGYFFPHFNNSVWKWDTLLYGDPRLQEFVNDPHRDNYYRYCEWDPIPRIGINGTQYSGKPLTSEMVLEGVDHTLDESYFRIKIDLNNLNDFNFIDNSAINDSTIKYSWYPINIPINEPGNISFDTIVGNPNWRHIEFVRIFWTDFDKSQIDKLIADDNMIEFEGFVFTED